MTTEGLPVFSGYYCPNRPSYDATLGASLALAFLLASRVLLFLLFYVRVHSKICEFQKLRHAVRYVTVSEFGRTDCRGHVPSGIKKPRSG